MICEVCHEPQSKTNIQRHKRIHHAADSADPKPYKCDPLCKYSTNRKDVLVKHQVDTNGPLRWVDHCRPFLIYRNKGSSCQVCGEHVPGSMKYHLNGHCNAALNIEKPYREAFYLKNQSLILLQPTNCPYWLSKQIARFAPSSRAF